MINAVTFPQRCQRLVCARCHEEGRGQASSRPGNFGNREGIQRGTGHRGHEHSWPGMGFFSGEPPSPGAPRELEEAPLGFGPRDHGGSFCLQLRLPWLH